ncbi:MAG: hypothetical protein NC307_08560 [Roseburia sp.]|nr:hypothetical protein [Roseburia sp.]
MKNGIIVCHDGRIYKYYAGEMLKENLQNLYMAIYFKRGYNEEKNRRAACKGWKNQLS